MCVYVPLAPAYVEWFVGKVPKYVFLCVNCVWECKEASRIGIPREEKSFERKIDMDVFD